MKRSGHTPLLEAGALDTGLFGTVLPLVPPWEPQRTGEQRLYLAILEDAVRIIKREVKYRKRDLVDETVAWVREDAMDHPFTFARCCEVLGFDPEPIRQQLLGMRVIQGGKVDRPKAKEQAA